MTNPLEIQSLILSRSGSHGGGLEENGGAGDLSAYISNAGSFKKNGGEK